MSYKVCYVTTLASTLESFCLKSALYNIEHGGWDVTFVSSYDRDFENVIPDNIKYLPVEIKRGVNISGLHSIIDLYRLFKREKYDLVQYATSNAGCYASIAAKLAGIPIRLYCEWGLGYVQLKGIRRLIFETVERIICKFSTNIRPDSFSNWEIGKKEGLYDVSNSNVIRCGSSCGVDLQRFRYDYRPIWDDEIREKYNIPKNAFVFGFVGRFQRDKGLNELLEAGMQLVNSYNDIYLMVIGDYNNQEKICNDLLETASECQRIIFCGYRRDVEKYYAAMNCLVLPSYHEGFPTSVIESQAMGTPAIVSNVPGCIDSIIPDKTGWTVLPRSSNNLLCVMKKIYEMKDLSEFSVASEKNVQDNFDQEDIFYDIFLDREMLLKGVIRSK